MDLYEIFFIPTLPAITLKLMEQPIGGGEGVRGFRSPIPRGAEHKKSFKDAFDIICDFRAHIFCSQTSQKLIKKHHEALPPEQLPSDALSQIDYGHTRLCDYCKEVCFCQRTTQRVFRKIWVGVYVWVSGRCLLPRHLHVSKRPAVSATPLPPL